MLFLSCEKNTRLDGDKSSWTVQPRVDHLLFTSGGRSLPGRVFAYSTQAYEDIYEVRERICAFKYQVNVELIASDRSALLVVSMQQVSIQTCPRPLARACLQEYYIF